MKAALAPAQGGRTLLMTLGSELRADDGVGPYLSSLVKFRRDGLRLIDAGTVPESVAQTAIDWKPAKIILVDAADFGGEPGELRVIALEDINKHTLVSTHNFPLSVTFSVVKEDTGAELAVIGVQAASLDHREALSPAVKAAADELAAYFNSL